LGAGLVGKFAVTKKRSASQLFCDFGDVEFIGVFTSSQPTANVFLHQLVSELLKHHQNCIHPHLIQSDGSIPLQESEVDLIGLTKPLQPTHDLLLKLHSITLVFRMNCDVDDSELSDV